MSDSRGTDMRGIDDDEPQGKVDLVSVLYVVTGIPGIVAFIAILFGLVHACPSVPA